MVYLIDMRVMPLDKASHWVYSKASFTIYDALENARNFIAKLRVMFLPAIVSLRP